MSTVIKPVSQMISGGSAANADQLGDAIALSAPEVGIDTVIEPSIGSIASTGGWDGSDTWLDDRIEPSIGSIASTGGWDAYEVWRRLIKDARDRRKQDSN